MKEVLKSDAMAAYVFLELCDYAIKLRRVNIENSLKSKVLSTLKSINRSGEIFFGDVVQKLNKDELYEVRENFKHKQLAMAGNSLSTSIVARNIKELLSANIEGVQAILNTAILVEADLRNEVNFLIKIIKAQ